MECYKREGDIASVLVLAQYGWPHFERTVFRLLESTALMSKFVFPGFFDFIVSILLLVADTLLTSIYSLHMNFL